MDGIQRRRSLFFLGIPAAFMIAGGWLRPSIFCSAAESRHTGRQAVVVPNGGFERGLVGWTIQGTGGTTQVTSERAADSHSMCHTHSSGIQVAVRGEACPMNDFDEDNILISCALRFDGYKFIEQTGFEQNRWISYHVV